MVSFCELKDKTEMTFPCQHCHDALIKPNGLHLPSLLLPPLFPQKLPELNPFREATFWSWRQEPRRRVEDAWDNQSSVTHTCIKCAGQENGGRYILPSGHTEGSLWFPVKWLSMHLRLLRSFTTSGHAHMKVLQIVLILECSSKEKTATTATWNHFKQCFVPKASSLRIEWHKTIINTGTLAVLKEPFPGG